MLDPESQAIRRDLTVMQAVVRALVRSHAGQSPGGLSDILSYLQIEANRLAMAAGGVEVGVVDALKVWTESLLGDDAGLGDVKTGDASGRPIQFVD